jgi:hypothetical protein
MAPVAQNRRRPPQNADRLLRYTRELQLPAMCSLEKGSLAPLVAYSSDADR